MIEVFDTHVFNTKVINNEAELDGSPFVAPETRSGSRFVVTFGLKASAKEIVGQDACLGKTITSLASFKVDPTITILTGEIVFFNELCRYVQDLDADVFWVRHGSVEVEVLQVDQAKLCPFLRQDTVEKKFDQFKQSRVGADVTWEANAIATNGDAGAIRIIFIRTHFTYYHGMAHIFLFMQRYVVIVNEKEGVSATEAVITLEKNRYADRH